MAICSADRRQFLRATGITIALPLLESLPRADAQAPRSRPPKRLVCIGNEFGMYPGAFWPKETGSHYTLPPLLEPLAPHRPDFTLFSHLDHGVQGGHFAVHTFLTGVKAQEARGLPDGGISLDQRAAEHVGSQTRFPVLNVGSPDGLHGGCQISWTRTGTRVPPIPGPRELYRALFIEDDAEARRQAMERLHLRESILDAVRDESRSLRRRLSRADSKKLDEYFAAIRDVETQLSLSRKWQNVPKPKPPFPEPQNRGLAKDLPMMYDLIALALQTDSTRVATLEVGGSFVARDIGIQQGYHNLSHHGHLPEKIKLLVQIERYQVEQFSRFLDKLKSLEDPRGGTLLEHTMVLFGSGMGNGNSHRNDNLPIVLAGGGFRHGEHRAYPSDPHRKVPLCKLYVSMLQQFGIDTDRFGPVTGTLPNWEVTG